MKTKPFIFILGIAISLILSLVLWLPVYAQIPSTDGGNNGFDAVIGQGSSECNTSPGSSSIESNVADTGNLHSLFSDAVYFIPPEFYRLTYTNPLTSEVYDSMCIRKGPETVCVPFESGTSEPDHPCETFTMTSGGVSCANTQWYINARVNFPVTFLDLRPYPATLVRWPTAARCGGLPSASGTGDISLYQFRWRKSGRPSTWRLAQSGLDPDAKPCRADVFYHASYRGVAITTGRFHWKS